MHKNFESKSSARPNSTGYIPSSPRPLIVGMTKFNWGGGGGKATKIFGPFGLCAGVMVMWSKIFDHDHDKNFEITMVK